MSPTILCHLRCLLVFSQDSHDDDDDDDMDSNLFSVCHFCAASQKTVFGQCCVCHLDIAKTKAVEDEELVISN